MLNQDDGLSPRLAWLHSTDRQRTLRVRCRSVHADAGRLSVFAPDFSLKEPQPWLLGDEIEWPMAKPAPLPPLEHRAEPSSADFARSFEDIMTRIESDEFKKVVPVVCEEFEFAQPLNYTMFHPQSRPHQFLYGFDVNGEGLIGQTPELLFEVDDDVLRTMALAGTGKTGGPSLLEDKKEMHEHLLVVEHIQSELREWGEVEIGVTEEREFGILKHLYTPIQVNLSRPADFLSLVVRLHPTAALGGWPRRPAVEWLERQSFHLARGRFGAPFGFKDNVRMLCVVAIRGLQWWGRRALVSSGCGVVRGSDVLKEWEELKLKRESIFDLLDVSL